MKKTGFMIALAFALPAKAQVEPVVTTNDPGIRDLNYSPTQSMRLIVSRGGDLTVTLADGEVPQSVSTAAPAAWQITLGTPANGFVVHAVPGAGDSTLSVLTNQHAYNFVLTAAPPTRAPYLIRMTYLETSMADGATAPNTAKEIKPARYRLTGNRELRPVGMTDDGSKTYIEWSPDQAIPAVFALDRLKREKMVNGYMRDDIFTIDRVYERLVFRIDRAMAIATRQNDGKIR